MPKKKRQVLSIDADAQFTQHIADSTATDGTEQDGISSVTVHHDAYLVGFVGSVRAALNALGEYIIIELSTSSNYQADINDNSSTIAVLGTEMAMVTDGALNSSLNISFNCKVFFRAGDKIYINQKGITGIENVKSFTLYWENF